MMDSGHNTMRMCDGCYGAFYCEQPADMGEKSDWKCETCVERAQEVARLRAALEPFAEFARRFNANPLSGVARADIVYSIHGGADTGVGADIRLSHCEAALKALGGRSPPDASVLIAILADFPGKSAMVRGLLREGLERFHGSACSMTGGAYPMNPAECEDATCRGWAKDTEEP